MAGHGDALSDDEDGADLDGADADAIEEARTGLDLLLSSLGRHIQPPLPTPLDPNPPIPETPAEPSSPDSIRVGTPATAGVSDTVLVGTSTSKSSSSRKVKLKQQRLSFGKSLSSVPVSEHVVTESTVRPSLDINVQKLVDAIYVDALEKHKTKWVEKFPWLVLTKTVRGLPAFKCSLCSKHAGFRGRCGRTGKGATDVQTQAFRKHAGTRKHKLALEKQEALLATATSQPCINEHRAAVDAEKIRVVSLLDVLLFVSRCDAPMGTWVTLVQYMAQKGVQGFPKKGYGTYYTTTDRCKGKHMIVYATFIRDNKLVSEFMQLITVEKADASTLLSLLLSHLQAVGVEVQRISGISTDAAGVMMGSRAGLVVCLRERVPHLVSCHCIAHRCGCCCIFPGLSLLFVQSSNTTIKFHRREALAAKEAAEALPVFDMVDGLVRVTADLLGRSARSTNSSWTSSSSSQRQAWKSRAYTKFGGCLGVRILAVWPAAVIFLKEYHSAMYLLATSYRFHIFMYFLVDVLEQLNLLNKFFQQRQIKRTTSNLESRYVDCGDDFGGGSSRWLSSFIERYGPGKKRDVTTEGVDSDGRPEKISFTLHDNPVDGYDGPEDHDGCIDLCTDFAERIMANLERRLGDLDSLSGVKLFMPDEWPKGKPERHARCVEWLLSLVMLFKAQDSEEILPGKVTIVHPGCSTSDWRESYPNLVQLWVAVAVITLSTAECERGFSCQNVIKSWLRGGLKDARLGDLMCLSLMPYEPVFDEVVDIWRSYKKRKPFSNSPISTPGESSKKGKVAAMEVEHPKPVDALDLSSDSDDDEDEEDDVDEDIAYRM
ncbi:unnamed protein product [Closterium sp. NIES-54]